jgi:hypothetical protein
MVFPSHTVRHHAIISGRMQQDYLKIGTITFSSVPAPHLHIIQTWFPVSLVTIITVKLDSLDNNANALCGKTHCGTVRDVPCHRIPVAIGLVGFIAQYPQHPQTLKWGYVMITLPEQTILYLICLKYGWCNLTTIIVDVHVYIQVYTEPLTHAVLALLGCVHTCNICHL